MTGRISCPQCTEEKRLVDPETEPEILGEIDGEAIRIMRYFGGERGATKISGPWLKVTCGNLRHSTPVFYAGTRPTPTTRLNCTALYIGHMYSSGIKDFLKDVLTLEVYSVDDLTQVLKEISAEGKNENTA